MTKIIQLLFGWAFSVAALALTIITPPAKVKAPAQCALMMAVAQVPEPGNPGHKQPPPGEHCDHVPNDPAHNCTCHRECKQNTDEEGNPAPGAYVQEDPKCRVYCFKDHCHCPVANCE